MIAGTPTMRVTSSLSIVIPAGAKLVEARRVVRSLVAQGAVEADIIVVIDRDGLADVDGDLGSHVTVAASLSRQAARNVGITRARGDIVVFLDPEVVPAPSLLRDIAAAAADGFDVISGPDERAARELHGLFRERPDSMLCALSLASSAVAIRRTALARAGHFVQTMPTLGDFELGLRLWERGARFVLLAGAQTGRMVDPLPAPRPSPIEVGALLERHPFQLVAAVCARLHEAPAPGWLLELVDAAPRDTPDAILGVAVPGSHALGERDLIDGLLVAVGASEHHRRAVTAYVRAATRDVLVRVGPGGEARLDQYLTADWLGRRSTIKELGLRQDYNFCHRTPAQRGQRAAGPRSIDVVGSYEVHLPTALVERLAAATISIPLPVACAPYQRDVRVHGFEPAELERYVNTRRDAVARFPIAAHAVLRYRFECTIDEQLSSVALAKQAIDTGPFSKVRLHAQDLAAANDVLEQVRAAHALDATAPIARRARALYEWIIDHVAYSQTNRPFSYVFEGWVGSCYHRSKLFVECCRLWGIPARERRGGLLGRTWTDHGLVWTEACGFGSSPLAHTWAEFCVDGEWVPVDFIGADYGARQLTRANVADPVLRDEIEHATTSLEDYYFGSLDPHRVRAADSAGRLVPYPIGRVPAEPAVQAQLLWQTRHLMRCQIRPR